MYMNINGSIMCNEYKKMIKNKNYSYNILTLKKYTVQGSDYTVLVVFSWGSEMPQDKLKCPIILMVVPL